MARIRPRGKTIPQSKLLGQNCGERLDTGAAGAAGGAYPAVAALEDVDRAEDLGRQG